MFDYETLRFIWWLLIGVILVVFMISTDLTWGSAVCCRWWRVMMMTPDSDTQRWCTWEGNRSG
ncbi:hypothetical protein ACLK18_05660 [Escherichia coli]